MSSVCVNYISGHIDTKYLDQASWIYDRMAASQRLKIVTSATMESPVSGTDHKCIKQMYSILITVLGLTRNPGSAS